MTYKFKWRRWFFYKTVVVIGHQYTPDQNKMGLFLPDGSVQEIKDWTKCEVKLGTDWVLFTKKQMEKQAGQSIPLAVGP